MEELNLIQTHLGIWKLSEWSLDVINTQLAGKLGVYCLKNLVTGKVLIGEGKLGGDGGRPKRHFTDSSSKIWNKDLFLHGRDNFCLDWIIEETDEVVRKILENKFQTYFSNNYNQLRRKYPSQKELIDDTFEGKYIHIGRQDFSTRVNQYTKIQRRDGFDECWETFSSTSISRPYGQIRFNGTKYKHHVLMYIFNYGDICGISSVIHHKCNNKKCVNPSHLELTTHIGNVHKYHNYEKENIPNQTSIFLGVSRFEKQDVYQSTIRIPEKIGLGLYKNPVHAAQNRDYYIVKNNLLSKKQGKLSFYDINYNEFSPWPQYGGKINKYL